MGMDLTKLSIGVIARRKEPQWQLWLKAWDEMSLYVTSPMLLAIIAIAVPFYLQ